MKHFYQLLLASLLIASSVDAAVRDPLGGLFGSAGSSVDYTFHHTPRSESGDARSAPVINTQRLRGTYVVSDNGTDSWSLQQGVAHFNLTESPVIPERQVQVPDSLWDISTGVTYTRQIEERRRFGGAVSVGSASDKPYNSLKETTAGVTAYSMIPTGERNAWIFAINYSNNRTFLNNIPLPGFAYSYLSKDGNIRALLGFPFISLSDRLTSTTNARFVLFGPRTIGLELSQRVAGPVTAYTAFDWNQMEWMRAGRNDVKNRLVYDAKRLSLGVRSPIGAGFFLDLFGGREFDRRFFENRSSSSHDVPRASLDNAWFLETQLSWRVGGPAHR